MSTSAPSRPSRRGVPTLLAALLAVVAVPLVSLGSAPATVDASGIVEVQVAGRAGVPGDVDAAYVNITATQASSAGFVTAWPCDESRPNSSIVNYVPATRAIANAALVPLDGGGAFCLWSSSPVELVVDVAGGVRDSSSTSFVTPSRLLDTRDVPGGRTGSGARFETLPPGSSLPSGAECAQRVRPAAENKPVNVGPNQVRGTSSNDRYPRVDGNFVGTTDEILQWAACKWGIDEDLVRAQAAKESWWRMDTGGDLTWNQSACHPVLRTSSGQCPESIGILQVRYPFHGEAFEGQNAIRSTAYNADYTYAVWRACFEGDLGWLNDVERGATYRGGDAWGCMGVWFAGRWYTQPAVEYLDVVRDYLDTRIWEADYFQNA